MKKIVFRVDSGNHIGIGHLMRCLTLAHEFKELGCKIFFITKDHKGFSKDIIPKNYTVLVLEGGRTTELESALKNDYASWLGESWEKDLEKTNTALKSCGGVDLVIIDHYALGESYEKNLICKKVMAIDDLMDRRHNCDYLLDQNTSADLKTYEALTNHKAQLFLGPQFALLKREFNLARSRNMEKRTINTAIKNILVFFGGADVGSDCLKLAKSLSPKELSHYKFTFILNELHSTYKELSDWASTHKKAVTVFSFVTNMAEVITAHDFFIGAGGSTSWERICLGIPSAIVSVADNQVKISESLSKRELIYYLGETENVNELVWRGFFENKISEQNYFHQMSQRCFNVLEGDGAVKLAHAVVENLK